MDLRRRTRTLVALLIVAAATGTAVADHDGLERNDDFETAASIDGGTYADLHVVDGESDYYAVQLADGEELAVDVRFTHADGDLDLWVYGPDRDEVDLSISTSDHERVTITAEEAGTHYVWVYSFTRATNSYRLGIVRSGGETPTPTAAPDRRTTTSDGAEHVSTSDGAGAADGDGVDIEDSPGFELSTALVALLGGLVILRRG